jgi:hypothetical protein
MRWICGTMLALVALLSTGCLGGYGGFPGTEAPPPTDSRPAVEATIIYPLGLPQRDRDRVTAGCPAGASCTTVVAPHSGGRWVRRIERTLTCGPATGTYVDPAAACRALSDLTAVLEHRRAICLCKVMIPGVQARAVVTTRDGVRRTLLLDFCTLCGLGEGALHDAKVLMPTVPLE